MTGDSIDLCLVPSEWVKRSYEEDSPRLRDRIAVWPAGVDVNYWTPGRSKPKGAPRALILRKALPAQANVADTDVVTAMDLFRRAGFTVALLEYGSFGRGRYRKALRAADVLVYFSPTESQGLAAVEAWAADVPTLVWSCGVLRYRERTIRSSSSPYLSDETGRFFRDPDELEDLIRRWDQWRPGLRPRDWVLRNMTDAHCARRYWDLARSNSPNPEGVRMQLGG